MQYVSPKLFRRTAWTAPGLLLLAAACGPRQEAAPEAAMPADFVVGEAVAAAGQEITATNLRDAIAYLADDARGGRGPGTAGDVATRNYLVEQMQAVGLEPGFGDSWQQPFDLVGVETHSPDRWEFRGGDGDTPLALEWSEEFIANSGRQQESVTVDDAELVFVGYGITAPEYEWDDYKGQDLSGKILLMLNNDPEGDDELFAGDTRLYYGRWTYKYEEAARQGAAGAIIIHTTPSAGYPWQVVQSSWTGPQMELPDEGEERVDVKAWVTEDAAARLLALAGQDLEALTEAARSRTFQPVPLGLHTSLELPTTITRVETANVAGLLRGSDPVLGAEAVIYTAHHDHLGTAESAEGEDAIYNGALDNASGTSVVLSLARAFSALPEPPRRSVLFLFVAAEEQGLLGSAYYARHPSIEPGRIAVNINVDGANILGRTHDVTYVGYGKSDLDAVVEAYAALQGRRVNPDQFPDRGFFYRSDQFNFAKIGVPAIYLDHGLDFVDRPEGWGREQADAWTEKHYHQPSDELQDDWNYEGMIEDAQLVFQIGVHLADAAQMPGWNPGDEFEAARLSALAALTAP